MSEEKIKISMSMDDLTFGEMELFENATGLVMSEAIKTEIVRDPKTRMPIPDPDDPKGRPLKEVKMGVRALMGMVYISMYREDPTVTFEQVRNIKISNVDMEIKEDDDSGKDES